jgi:cytochrome P450
MIPKVEASWQAGDIVRIGPNELHINDPEWFDTLYSNSAKLDKDPFFYGLMAIETSVFSTTPYHEHRSKRSIINPFFSKANVDRSEPLLRKVLLNMIGVLDQAEGPVQLKYAFKSYAIDVVSEFCFPEGSEKAKANDFSATFHEGQEAFTKNLPWFRHFPILVTLATNLPKWVDSHLPEEGQQSIRYIRVSVRHSET